MSDNSNKTSALVGQRALVVDTDQHNLSRVRSFLETAGLCVSEEINGSRGLDRILNVDFDVVFIADRLPVIDGNQVVELLRKERRSPPIVWMTIDLTTRDWSEMGFNAVLRKPVCADELMQVLIELSKPGTARGSEKQSNVITRIEKLQRFLLRPRPGPAQATESSPFR